MTTDVRRLIWEGRLGIIFYFCLTNLPRMFFEQDRLYHVFNRGDNGRKIFFSEENYDYFLLKMRQHILPHADVLAWCLMPNHYHLLFYVHTLELELKGKRNFKGFETEGKPEYNYLSNLNKSIGILLASYTRAINREKGLSGSLFKKNSKAICMNSNDGLTPSYFNTQTGAICYDQFKFNYYPQSCFDYIHNNPVKAKLVMRPDKWKFSSYSEYVGTADRNFISFDRIKEFGIV
jgi:putative transposase